VKALSRLVIVQAPAVVALLIASGLLATEPPPIVPRFSVANMDRSVDPAADFYHFAAGNWLRSNPVPADKSRWSGFEELQERNWRLVREILEVSALQKGPTTNPARLQVGDFYASAMDTNRIEKLGFKPIASDLKRIDRLKSTTALFELLGDFHERGIGAFFGAGVSPDAKNSSVYAFELSQGGLGLPDRDYYLKDDFAKQREDYRAHITTLLTLLGEKPADASTHAALVLDLETALARVSRTRVDLRDPNANYNKFAVADLVAKNPSLAWPRYLEAGGIGKLQSLIVGQPEFFAALDKLVQERPLGDWKVYLRWHLVRSTAPFLHEAAEKENFAFYSTKLRGQPEPEPRWQRAAHVIDGSIGEALGRIYVEKYFPPTARARMNELIGNIRDVFRDRLKKLEWMSDATRAKALAKFDRFTQKVGHPEKFRDYSKIALRRDDYLGNIQRAARFESRRETARIGQPVDKSEWHMTPQTVNAYFNPLQNEIVFPAGILQPPFFDVDADDAVNYGAIGVVIGHEITHGYDDTGRQYDADGNLNDWWTDKDAKEFDARAEKVVDQYASYEALPGLKVNGKLTLGENIADLGGTSIAYEALQRALARNPAKRAAIDGFTPEQRFFLSLAQLWRVNWREAELRRRIVTDPHSPAQFRAIGPHVNLQEFYDAFGIKEGAPMWRRPELRAKIW
jgi:putative endopeptidase